jgi:transposase-like protein
MVYYATKTAIYARHLSCCLRTSLSSGAIREELAQHFLLSSAARKWQEADIEKMSEDDARMKFRELVFAKNNGRVICPRCGCDAVYELKSRPVFKCKSCLRQFSITTGTPFADHKLPFKKILLAIKLFCGSSKGLSAVELQRHLDIAYKTAFVIQHKLRGLMARHLASLTLSGQVEIDGCEIGGHLRPTNVKKKSQDFRKFPNRNSKKKQSIIVVRERNGRAKTSIFKGESDSIPFVVKSIQQGSKLFADSAACYNVLEANFEMGRINHKVAYYTEEASTNWAESFFSMIRRSAFGTYHRIAGKYLDRYAAEIAWRQNFRKSRHDEKFRALLALVRDDSEIEFVGYWQHRKRKERYGQSDGSLRS